MNQRLALDLVQGQDNLVHLVYLVYLFTATLEVQIKGTAVVVTTPWHRR